MKTYSTLFMSFFLGLFTLPMTFQLAYADTSDDWVMVQEAESKGLPKSALEHVERILVATDSDERNGEWLRAFAEKLKLQAEIEGRSPEARIIALQNELSTKGASSNATDSNALGRNRAIISAILANWYWSYFEQNRWQFSQRTQTAVVQSDTQSDTQSEIATRINDQIDNDGVGDGKEQQTEGGKKTEQSDFTTWDLPRLFKHIDKLFSVALQNKRELTQIPLSTLSDFLIAGSMPATVRPTLYDFIAHEALEFYESAEQAGAQPEDYFQISADSQAFGALEDFLRYAPETTDIDSPTLKAISLYKALLAEHRSSGNIDALVDLELNRLRFVKNSSVGEEKEDKYIAQLQALLKRYPDSSVISLVYYNLARAWGQKGELAKAHQTTNDCIARGAQAIGGQACSAYRADIEMKSLGISAEQVITPTGDEASPTYSFSKKAAKLHVTYKNFETLHLRIVEDDWKRFMSKKWSYPEQVSSDDAEIALGSRPVKEWLITLPTTTDFKENSIDVELPNLKPGYYRIFASTQPNFSTSEMVQHTGFWVSDYTLITRPRNGQIEGLVVNAKSGEPIAGAVLKRIYRDNESYRFGTQTVSDTQGIFRLDDWSTSGDNHVYLSYNNQELLDSNSIYSGRASKPRPSEQTLFFTDRSLYRPGQTIHFKGIYVRIDSEKNNYQTLADRKVMVMLRDANGQEVSRQDYQTNDFGSFSGTFTAPANRLMGQMSISSQGGQAVIRVEEYKRPKFSVKLETPTESFRLKDQVVVSGRAENYNGAAVDGATVRFQVRRTVRWPVWCFYCAYDSMTPQAAQEIAHGVVKTASDGTFKIEFAAKPDLTVSEKNDPSFQFTVSADVTSTAGETRSALKSVTIGYSALALNPTVPSFIRAKEKFDLTILPQTLDGQPVAAGQVEVKLYSVLQPDEPIPANLSEEGMPWRNFRSRNQSNRLAYNKHNGDGNSGENIDNDDWRMWSRDKLVNSTQLDSRNTSPLMLPLSLEEGLYQIEVLGKDRYGRLVKATLPIMVTPPLNAKHTSLKLPAVMELLDQTVKVGSSARLFWGTGYNAGDSKGSSNGRALIEVEHKGKTLQRYWTEAGVTAHVLQYPVGPELRGGFNVRATQVRENRAYIREFNINVPWDNKELAVSAETFRDKLRPGDQEVWKFKVKGEGKELRAAEFAATLYDSSLDQFYSHSWSRLSFFGTGYQPTYSTFVNRAKQLQTLRDNWNTSVARPSLTYPQFPSSLTLEHHRYRTLEMDGGIGDMDDGLVSASMMASAPASEMTKSGFKNKRFADKAAPEDARQSVGGSERQGDVDGLSDGAVGGLTPDLSQVSVRKNLQETAFFYPHLLLEKDGSVSVSFTVPEALTKWKFLGLAHGVECESGVVLNYATTQKELMVQPNAPRFVREGDDLWFSASVINMTDQPQTGQVRLDIKDLLSDKEMNSQLIQKDASTQQIILAPKESKAVSWNLKIPVGTNPIAYTVAAATNNFSDAEAGAIPVVSSRVYVTESLPLSIRGKQEKVFNFERLLAIQGNIQGNIPGGVQGNLKDGQTLEPHRLTVQVASNPAWYAVQALPYLIEYPYECSEQIFNRLYANSLATEIANSQPRIRQIFDSWKGTDALKSNLEKNEQLKSAILEETPWVLEAKGESQAKQNVGLLFESNTLQSNLEKAYTKLASMQLSNGAWSWFPGGRPDNFITLYVVTGFGRLRNMGVEIQTKLPVRSLAYLDGWVLSMYNDLKERQDNNLTSTIALYLYARSFFLGDQPIANASLVAVDYYRGQSKKHWLSLNSRMSQGYIALAAKRFGDLELANQIVASLKERSVSSEEFGLYWRDAEGSNDGSWWWHQAPIETQSLMIEVFKEVTNDTAAVEDAKVWLLKQKQTQHWKTTKATADAIYALLLSGLDSGNNWLSSKELVTTMLGEQTVEPKAVEPGTGYYEVAYNGKDILPTFSKITLTKKDDGIAWGGVHFQYFEDISKVTSHKSHLSLDKQLFVKRSTKRGDVIEPVKGALEVGDTIIARIVLKTDRDMEYVHLKDGRASGVEPVNVLSQYKSQDGLYYYESTRDTASHFFIDYLPKGTYVFEYPMKVQLKGRYQSGFAEIQCMYAPEFNSHSQSVLLEVR